MGQLGVFENDRIKWFPFDEDTEVCIKHVGKEELNKIRGKAVKAAKLAGADIAAVMNQRLGKAAVLGWRKVEEPEHPGLIINGQPFPFNDQNRDFLMAKSLEFSNFVNETAINSREYLEGVEETKNA